MMQVNEKRHPAITGKVILVTGGVGFIGTHLVDYILENYNPKIIRIFDKDESGLFYASQKYSKKKNIRYLQGDVRDKDRVKWAMDGVDTIFHVAALKHVGLSEYTPMETVKTNIYGTQNVLEAALTSNVETHVTISTDKAVYPDSVMGATKLLAERLTSSYKSMRVNTKTKFLSVRFGNVFNSTGSVARVFVDQLKAGKPLTITDKSMTRFFMNVDEAVGLILKATKISRGGEVFILKMPIIKVSDLAEVFIEQYAKKHKINSSNIQTEIIGKRPGEKYEEILLNENEAENALEISDMYIIPRAVSSIPNYSNKHYRIIDYYKKEYGAVPFSNNHQLRLLKKRQIVGMLKKAKIIDEL